MNRRRGKSRLTGGAIAAGLLLAALLGALFGAPRGQATAVAGATWDIELTAAGFVPPSVHIQPGDSVRWTNRTARVHVLRSGQPRRLYLPLILRVGGNAAAAAGALPFDRLRMPPAAAADGEFAATLQPGGQFTQTFSLTGTFPFYAATAPHFSGEMIVDAPAATPTPTATSTPTATATPTPTVTPTPTDPGPHLPPHPADVAPALSQNAIPAFRDAAAFLYSGADPIQTGVVSGTIELSRAAVLRGRVLGQDAAPLSWVTVTLLHHPELGRTLSREDGRFDLAVNGGGPLTLVYTRTGYLPVQRTLDVPWQEFTHLPDVTLTALDPHVTPIELASHLPMQIARGSVISDARGLRQETLLFPAGLTARMTLPGGVTQTLTALHVRATEFTTGEDGPQAMPAALPPNSAYTYAAEFSVDEAVAAGALDVAFDPAVLSYNENFLGFPVGTQIPMGYYDRRRAVWVAGESGRVVGILGVADGLALLDVDGSNQPADPAGLAALGITDAERAALASLYAAGQSLWRVPVLHFSPWDKNMGVACQEPCDPPNQPPPQPMRVVEPECRPGSIIECQNQALAERVAVAGAAFYLRYQSDRAAGRRAEYALRIPLSGPELSPTLLAIHLEIEVAGQRHTQTFSPPSANLTYTFTWDGRDAYGRPLQGAFPATVRIGYGYRLAYAATDRFGYNGDGIPISLTSEEFILWQLWRGNLGGWDALPQGLGGWSLSVHHAYDPVGRVFYGGDGRRRQMTPQDLIISSAAGPAGLERPTDVVAGPDGSLYIADGTRIWRRWPDGSLTHFAGAGGWGYGGDGGPATQALFTEPQGLALAADGSLYVADTFNQRVRRIRPDGIVETVAGDGVAGFAGDGGPAISARLNQPYAVAVAAAADGSLFIADRNNYRVRRVGTDGLIATVAGIGFIGYDNHHHGNGGPASQAGLVDPREVAVGPGGRLYIGNEHVVRLVEADGLISTVAGIGGLCNFGCYSGDGGPAVAAQLQAVDDIAVGPDGSLFLAEGNQVIRHVSPAGIINTLVGSGAYGFSGDGGPARLARLHFPLGVAVGPDGSLFIADQNNRRIRRVAPAQPGLTVGEILLPGEDGGEVYVFDSQGRHLRTLHGLTGGLLFSFGYDSAGRLATVTDGDGNLTRIERDGAGQPAAILAPFGQRTGLALSVAEGLTTDAAGHLAGISDPTGAAWRFDYAADGLLVGLTNPRGHRWDFTYDGLGRLTAHADPTGGRRVTDPPGASSPISGMHLARLDARNGYTVALTSPLARVTAWRVEALATRAEARARTNPDGTTDREERQPSGDIRRTLADGSRAAWQAAPDPRWGMNAPLPAVQRTETPGGLVATAAVQRSVALANPADPLSLLALEETVTLNGRAWRTLYDGASRTFTQQTPLGRQRSETLDGQGRPLSWGLAGLYATSYAYDSHGRPLTVTVGSGADARQTRLAYDAAGQVSAVTDPLGRTTRYGYDAAGRVISETLPDGRQTLYAYDAAGNLAALTPPGRAAHTFTYTPVDLLASYAPPPASDTGASSLDATGYTYDGDRNLTRAQRADGRRIDIAYDVAGRPHAFTLARGVVAFAYHPASGLLAGIAAPGGVSLTLDYDGDLPVTQSWRGPISGSLAYAYDTDFRLVSLSLNRAQTTTFAYDDDGLLVAAGDLTLSRSGQNGLLTGSGLGGVTDAYGYNGFGEPISYTASFGGGLLLGFRYGYDGLGRIVTRTETVGGATDVYVYGYDLAGRLATVKKNGAALSAYTYDANGNRTSFSGMGGPASGTYDGQDRLMSYGGALYSYSADGELQSKTVGGQTTAYTYDELGNLTGVTLPDGTQIVYLVDGLNRRVGRRVNGGLTAGWLYDDRLRVVAELDGAGVVVSRFVYARHLNVPDAMERGGLLYRILTDHLGSPRLVVDAATGVVVQRMDYDEFGRVLTDTNPGFQPFGFAGGLYDAQTGLVRFGARDYDASSGRWTARDPILFAGGQANLYAYAGNDPVNRSDAEGLEDWGNSTFDRRQMCRNQCAVHAMRGGRGGTRGCENEPTFYRGDASAELRCIRACEENIRMAPKPGYSKLGWFSILRELGRQLLRKIGGR